MREQEAWQGDILSEMFLVSSSATHNIYITAVPVVSLRTITI